ncbi:MAG: energy transducer TonB [Candidatus Marinimicrobia bacterium]|nr:energy transducer TonB [Candidatus Neomarinimicrobiota bacterium]
MLTQYPWVSVKNQERKHIEIGAMVTLLAATVSFYTIPDFSDRVITERPYEPPPVEVVHIPATIQPPEAVKPLRPTMVVESETEDIDDFVDDIIIGTTPPIDLTPPAPPDIPPVDFWAAEEKPFPIGGWGVINRSVVYPPIAIEARQEGKVVIKVVIGKDGIVKEAYVLSGIPGSGLDEAALTAVLNTTFNPAYQRDKPVEVSMAIPVDFRLR